MGKLMYIILNINMSITMLISSIYSLTDPGQPNFRPSSRNVAQPTEGRKEWNASTRTTRSATDIVPFRPHIWSVLRFKWALSRWLSMLSISTTPEKSYVASGTWDPKSVTLSFSPSWLEEGESLCKFEGTQSSLSSSSSTPYSFSSNPRSGTPLDGNRSCTWTRQRWRLKD